MHEENDTGCVFMGKIRRKFIALPAATRVYIYIRQHIQNALEFEMMRVREYKYDLHITIFEKIQ